MTNSNLSICQQVGNNGAWLSLEEAGAALSIPEGALPKGITENIQLSIITDDRCRPKLPEGN